jgi:hypothetical protein
MGAAASRERPRAPDGRGAPSQVAARKQEMIYGSKVGLPGTAKPAAAAPNGFEDDDMPNIGSMRLEDSGRGGPPTRAAPRGSSIWDVDGDEPAGVNPYGATLPSQARMQQGGEAGRTCMDGMKR